MIMKTCNRCGCSKPEDQFPVRSPDYKGRVYLRAQCEPCFKELKRESDERYNERMKALRQANPKRKPAMSKDEKAKKSADYQRTYLAEMRRLAALGRKYESMLKGNA